MHLLLAALLFAAASEGRLPKQISRDPRTVGMGKSCRKNSECKHRSQRCVHRSDAQGKPLDAGICVLPCASFEAGPQKGKPGGPVAVTPKAKKPPPGGPGTNQGRSAGARGPSDIWVKQKMLRVHGSTPAV